MKLLYLSAIFSCFWFSPLSAQKSYFRLKNDSIPQYKRALTLDGPDGAILYHWRRKSVKKPNQYWRVGLSLFQGEPYRLESSFQVLAPSTSRRQETEFRLNSAVEVVFGKERIWRPIPQLSGFELVRGLDFLGQFRTTLSRRESSSVYKDRENFPRVGFLPFFGARYHFAQHWFLAVETGAEIRVFRYSYIREFKTVSSGSIKAVSTGTGFFLSTLPIRSIKIGFHF
jgi:hypothetical protein